MVLRPSPMAENPDTAVWDFAYSTGTHEVSSRKTPLNTFTTPESNAQPTPPPPQRQRRSESKRSLSSIIVNRFHPVPSAEAKAEAVAAEICSDTGKSRSPASTVKTKTKRQHGRKERQETSTLTPPTKTYLLSIPNADRVYCSQMKSTVSTLLLTNHTQLVLLVPQSHVVCPRMGDLLRLPKAVGSGIRILPVSPDICMEYGCGGGGGSENDDDMYASFDRRLEMLAVQETAAKVVKCTKVTHFDGYLAFEDERASWVFLERVAKSVAGGKER